MSLFFTLNKRGLTPVNTIYDALSVSLDTGQLPPIPK